MPLVYKVKGLKQASVAKVGVSASVSYPTPTGAPLGSPLGLSSKKSSQARSTVVWAPVHQAQDFVPGASESGELIQSLLRPIPRRCSHSKGKLRESAFSRPGGKDSGQEGSIRGCAGQNPRPREAESSGVSGAGGTWSQKERRDLRLISNAPIVWWWVGRGYFLLL